MKQLRVLLFSILAFAGSSAFAQASLDWTVPPGYREIDPDTLHYYYDMKYADLPASSREFVDASFQFDFLLGLKKAEPKKNSADYQQWQQAWNFLTGEFRKMHEGKTFYMRTYDLVGDGITDIFKTSITHPIEDDNLYDAIVKMPAFQPYHSAGEYISRTVSSRTSEDETGPHGGRIIDEDTLHCTPAQKYAELDGYCKEYLNDVFGINIFLPLEESTPDSTNTTDFRKYLKVKDFVYTQFKNMYEGKPFYCIDYNSDVPGSTNLVAASGLPVPPEEVLLKVPEPWEGILINRMLGVRFYQTAGEFICRWQDENKKEVEKNAKEYEIARQQEAEADRRRAEEARQREIRQRRQREMQQIRQAEKK